MRMPAFAVFAITAAFENEPRFWTEFKTTHGRRYSDRAEELRRFEIFTANLAFIAAENAKEQDFTLAPNQFTDMTADELAATSMGLFAEEELPEMGVHTWGGEELPDEIDWTEQGAVTPVKNQKRCGSCWAFSAIGALEGAFALAGNNLTAFSEQQLVDCAGHAYGNAGCHGGRMPGTFRYAREHALCSEESYAYLGKAHPKKCRAETCDVALVKGRVVGLKRVGHRAEDLMSALTKQPVSVGIKSDGRAFHHYRDGVFSRFCGTSMGHVVLAVGYGVWHGLQRDLKYWKVKNSWGAGWGKDGYILLTREAGTWGRKGKCLSNSSGGLYPEITSDELVV